ncbi:hypothetical protein THRCLA_06768, partial [Thraustotheca clavata]
KMLNWFKKSATPPPRVYSFEGLVGVHQQLIRYRELPEATLVELLRVLSEFLIYSDQHQGMFFEYFCEKNMMALFVAMMVNDRPSLRVQIQLLQTLSLFVQNLSTATSLYYILSNNYINKLLTCRHFELDNEDVRDWYVTFLKALSIRLTIDTVQFFFNSATRTFPLYVEALKFQNCAEIQVQIAVKTVLLNVLRVPDDRMRRFLTTPQNMVYFFDLVSLNVSLAFELQNTLNKMPKTLEHFNYTEDKLVDQWYYLQDILEVPMPDLCFQLGECLFEKYLKHTLAFSLLPNCAASESRLNTLLSLHLLTQFFLRASHTPLLHATAAMLLHPELQGTSYMTAALGMGDKKTIQRTQSQDSFLSRESVSLTNEPSTISQSLSSSSLQLNVSPTSPRHSSSAAIPPFASTLPPLLFQPHNLPEEIPCADTCYLSTRFAFGEWSSGDVVAASFDLTKNVFRQALIRLIQVSDAGLRLATIALLRAIMRNSNIDRSLLKDIQLIPRLAQRLSVSSPKPVDAAFGYDDDEDDDDEDEEEDEVNSNLEQSSDSSVSPPSPYIYDSQLLHGLLNEVEAPASLRALQIALDLLANMTISNGIPGSNSAKTLPLVTPSPSPHCHPPCWAQEESFLGRLASILMAYQARIDDKSFASWEEAIIPIIDAHRDTEFPVEWTDLTRSKSTPSVLQMYMEILTAFDRLHILDTSNLWNGNLREHFGAVALDQQDDTAKLAVHFKQKEPLPLAERSFLPCVWLQNGRRIDVYCLLNADRFVVVRPDTLDRTLGHVLFLEPLHLLTIDAGADILRVTGGAIDVVVEFPISEMCGQMVQHLEAMQNQQRTRKSEGIEQLLGMQLIRSHLFLSDISMPIVNFAMEDSHCLYRNKLCLLPRALKKNGQLHSLCEFHRVKANRNQRRLEKKKRSKCELSNTPNARTGCKELWIDPNSSEDDEEEEDDLPDKVIWAEPIRVPTVP